MSTNAEQRAEWRSDALTMPSSRPNYDARIVVLIDEIEVLLAELKEQNK